MPRFDPPTSDRGRLAMLKRAHETATADLASGFSYISQSTYDQLPDFIAGYEAAIVETEAKFDIRMQETLESETAVSWLKEYLRDFWEGARRRQRRERQPATVLGFYGLVLDGVNPEADTREGWLSLAEVVTNGDANAVTAGYLPMNNPSAAEVQTRLNAARQEVAEVSAADRVLDESQERIVSLRDQANLLIEEIVADIRYNGRRLDPPGIRRIVRIHGGKYRYDEGEPRDEDDPPPDEENG